jgi:ribosomal-protein-alanine N-acetyltransferase
VIDYGHGVKLGPLRDNDSEKVFEWRNDPRIWKWCRQNTVLNWDNHTYWFHAMQKDPTVDMLAIHGPSELLGVCGLTSIDRLNRRAEFSLYINPERHNRGYGSQALKTLFSHGFKNHNLNTIWGETYAGNPARKTFEKIGMHLDGTLKESYFRGGKFIDSYLYSITAQEWAG